MPATATKLLTDVAHLATTTVGSQLRINGHSLVFIAQPQARSEEIAREVAEVRNSATFLELILVSVCAHEALAETRADTFEASGKDQAYFAKRVRELSGLDPARVIREVETSGLLQHLPPPPPRMPPLSEVVRAARTVVESCPIDMLDTLARAHGLEVWSHRCRVAYNALRAFIRRQDPGESERIGIVGREYSRGALSMNDVATLLQVHPVDAIVLLEERGYFRSMDALRLGEENRRARYDSIRQDRLARAGRFAPTPEQVARDVIASERIEGVDARPWIRPSAR